MLSRERGDLEFGKTETSVQKLRSKVLLLHNIKIELLEPMEPLDPGPWSLRIPLCHLYWAHGKTGSLESLEPMDPLGPIRLSCTTSPLQCNMQQIQCAPQSHHAPKSNCTPQSHHTQQRKCRPKSNCTPRSQFTKRNHCAQWNLCAQQIQCAERSQFTPWSHCSSLNRSTLRNH